MVSMVQTPRIFKYANFNVSALCLLGAELRNGQRCYCNPSQLPSCGSFNWAILMSFADGVEWVFRSPRIDGTISSDDTDLLLLASEAATLKYIKAYSNIPVPDIYDYR